MNKFRVLLGAFAIACVALLARPVVAAISTPQDLEGHTIQTADWVGAFPCYIDASNTTTAVECSSNNAVMGGRVFDTTGRGEVIGIIYSSAPASTSASYLVFRDTAIANVTSSTMAIIGALSAGNTSVTAGQTVIYKFPVPIQYQTGLSVNAPTAIPAGSSITILYRPFKQID